MRQGMKNFMPFVYRLHLSLALGSWGAYALGVAALLWTLDCFIGAYLTFPIRRRTSSHHQFKKNKSWLARWLPAWKLRTDGSAYKINFDLHRAGGLWLWGMLLVFAWSSVAFSLPEVYAPVMKAVLKHQPDIDSMSQKTGAPAQAISWSEARAVGRDLMAQQARTHGFQILEENGLVYDEALQLYRYWVRSSLDVDNRKGATSLFLHAKTGALLGTWLPTTAASGDTFRTWIATLHRGNVWGIPYRLFVFLLGLAVMLLVITGIIIWYKKWSARTA